MHSDAQSDAAVRGNTGRFWSACQAESQNVNYEPFLGPISRWQQASMKVVEAGPRTGAIDGRTLLTYRTGPGVESDLQSTIQAVRGASKTVEQVRNALCFELPLGPGQSQSIELVATASSRLNPATEPAHMAAMTFSATLARADAYWDRPLQLGMKLTTPEPRLRTLSTST